jgi:hypothetical protein
LERSNGSRGFGGGGRQNERREERNEKDRWIGKDSKDRRGLLEHDEEQSGQGRDAAVNRKEERDRVYGYGYGKDERTAGNETRRGTYGEHVKGRSGKSHSVNTEESRYGRRDELRNEKGGYGKLERYDERDGKRPHSVGRRGDSTKKDDYGDVERDTRNKRHRDDGKGGNSSDSSAEHDKKKKHKNHKHKHKDDDSKKKSKKDKKEKVGCRG